MSTQTTISPVDGSVYAEREHASEAQLESALDAATKAQRSWRTTPLAERAERLGALLDEVQRRAPELSTELTWQMGRPASQTPGELRGFDERGRRMIELGLEVLADQPAQERPGFRRFIRREPRGVALVLAPWNYPWLTAVNAVVPALMAGNAVLLKHSDQTPLVCERMVEAARVAGIEPGVFDFLHLTHEAVAKAVADPRVNYVSFTGSVGGGRAVHAAAGGHFKSVGLELGGKDPGYVCADADAKSAAEGLVDGAFFNSGQSCCGIERVYVHADRYESFVEAAVELVRAYQLGDPTQEGTNLGPVVRASSAASIRAQVDAAVAQGAKPLIDASKFAATKRGDPYLAPQLLVDVDHSMEVMREETFGPVLGVMAVKDDAEAIARMNDSRYGLTASIWTPDLERAAAIGGALETGTVFANRCDYLDPDLAWVGVKDSGNGVTLSRLGYEPLTRPKSFHFREA